MVRKMSLATDTVNRGLDEQVKSKLVSLYRPSGWP